MVKTKELEVKIEELTPTAKNPRKISKKDLEVLKKSLREFPEMKQIRKVVVDENMRILGGHQRVKALEAIGEKTVPVLQVIGLTEEQKDEFIIKDNIANGEWDMDKLAEEWDAEKLGEWGLDEFKPLKDIVEDDPDPIDEENTFSLIGEIYQLGEHRVFCGSFDDSEKVRELFGNKKATCTFTDPPYNVDYKSPGNGQKIKNDSMSREDFLDFLSKAFNVVAEKTVTGGGVISWMSDRELFTLWDAMKRAGLKFRQTLIWVKNSMVMGRTDFHYQGESAIYSFNEGSFSDIPEGEDEGDCEQAIYCRGNGKFRSDRKLKNAWFFARPNRSKEHPTMKPVGLCAKGVLALSGPGDIVFDPFLGSGSTLIAAEQTGRVCYGCEIDPKYCDVIRKRYWKFVNGSEESWEEGTPCLKKC